MWEVRRVAYASNQRRLVASWTPWGLTRSWYQEGTCDATARLECGTRGLVAAIMPVSLYLTIYSEQAGNQKNYFENMVVFT